MGHHASRIIFNMVNRLDGLLFDTARGRGRLVTLR